MYNLKYKYHIFSLKNNAVNIHPIWLIEEKAITFRNEVWFRPPNDPTIMEEIIIIKIILLNIEYEIIIIGVIFCQVIMINLFNQFRPSKTLGNQKWKGAAPNLIIKDE